MPSLILRAVTPVLMVLLIVFSIYALLRGHHEPGGGFVGGLIIASAFSLHALAYDVPSTLRLLRIPPYMLMGMGLATLLLSGILGFVAGGSFLQGIWISIPVPGLGPIAVGTPVLFDIGVYAAVMGMVLMIILMAAEVNT